MLTVVPTMVALNVGHHRPVGHDMLAVSPVDVALRWSGALRRVAGLIVKFSAWRLHRALLFPVQRQQMVCAMFLRAQPQQQPLRAVGAEAGAARAATVTGV